MIRWISNNNLFPYRLRCEFKSDPLGIDSQHPLLSWIIKSKDESIRGLTQRAFRVIVSSSIENLDNNNGDVWDSGKIISDDYSIIYSGKILVSKTEYWWKVKAWDNTDQESSWSKPAIWITGLLNKSDWKANWIFSPESINTNPPDNSKEFVEEQDRWIWYPAASTGRYYFRKNITIHDLNSLESANVLVTADESFILYINGEKVSESDGRIFSWARPQFITVKSFLRKGTNLIAAECINTYLQKPGLCLKLILRSIAETTIHHTDNDWKVSDKKNDNWNRTDFDDSRWINASITTVMGKKPWRVPNINLILPPPPYFRKEFDTSKKVKHAFIYVSALGLYKVYLNGTVISEDKLTPGWTDYNKRVYYNTYKVTDLVRNAGSNCLGVILADGWFSGYVGWEKGRGYYGKYPLLLLQLEVEYEDGTSEIFCSDSEWKTSTGAHLEADLLMGESYDASRFSSGWLEPGFNDIVWKNALTTDDINPELNSYPGIPVRNTIDLKPVRITSIQKGIYLFDMGQNMAGVVRLKINGTKTTKVHLRFAEMLDENGELYTENIRMARAADTYYSAGNEEEIWQPDFTYHGFRYVEARGLQSDPDTITGIVLHSDLPVTGSFRCSDERLNILYNSIFWSQRSNYIDIPTDCPQRDERLGWAADAIDFIRTAAFNMDVSSFFIKWLRDLNDAQETNGAYPAIAPKPDLGVGPLFAGAAGWADAGIITPYVIYQYYRDKRILEICYDNMVRYMNYLEGDSKNFLRPDYGYGDWLSVEADTPKDFIATVFYGYDALLMSWISGILNKQGNAGKYLQLYENIKTAFVKEFIDEKGSLRIKTQTAYVLAISFNMLDEEKQSLAASHLIEDIKFRDYHVSTGFIGLAYLFPVLSKFGRSDIVYKILLNESPPSWLNMINNNATTMWERWDSWSPVKGFYDPLMNSFNHTSLGVIGEWFYSGIGGITAVEAGFKKMVIRPLPGGGLKFAEISFDSMYGLIKVYWEIKGNIFTTKISIPVNTSAEVILQRSSESSLLTDQENPVISQTENEYIIKIVSGSWLFEVSNIQVS
jgi:alpha-L-rhamnosidase